MDYQAIHTEAHKAAVDAENAFLATYGEHAYCGFAWVDVFVDRTNSKDAKGLLALGYRKSWKPKTINLWSCGNYRGQCMGVKEAGADAYAEVLRKYGFRAYSGSRPD